MATAEVLEKASSRRHLEGVVLSDKMQKTIVVQAIMQVRHPKYGKYYKKYQKFKAHDEKEECSVGDRVEIIESRPISKDKRFRLVKILEKAKKAEVDMDLGEAAAV